MHVAACVRMSFFLKMSKYAIMCIDHILFICSPLDGLQPNSNLLTFQNCVFWY